MNISKMIKIGLTFCLTLTAACSGGGGGSKAQPSTNVTLEQFQEFTLDQKIDHLDNGTQSLSSRGLLTETDYGFELPENLSQEQLATLDKELADIITKAEITKTEIEASPDSGYDARGLAEAIDAMKILRSKAQYRLGSSTLSPSTSYH